ncbi:hypothetical protein BKA93DRAFT_735065 [Sparassis latifolia]
MVTAVAAPVIEICRDILADTTVQAAVTKDVENLANDIPILLQALDEVAKLHPFIAVAVIAFKVAYNLEMTRRQNNAKIEALFVEMTDMMKVLRDLKSINDVESPGPDGISVKDRLLDLIEKTADDIKGCANACDTYAKMHIIVKVVKSSLWQNTLTGFVQLFAQRRAEFIFALSIHTSVGVHQANQKLEDVDDIAHRIDERTRLLLDYFQVWNTPREEKINKAFMQMGSPELILDSTHYIEELLVLAHDSDEDITFRPSGSERGMQKSMEQIKQELRDAPDVAIKNNLSSFEGKFDLQRRQIVDQLSQVMHREGDRIISEVTAGPQEKIKDPDLYAIWLEMRWRGSVEARQLVHAIKEHYRDATEKNENSKDRWALEWINRIGLQPIVEAFDDDASGYVTISEANDLMASRPAGWSLLHWLVYWAVGWRLAASAYKTRIDELLSKMFSLRPHIHPANRFAVESYLNSVWANVAKLTSSLQSCTAAESLQARFRNYWEAEDQRIRRNLEDVRYRLEDMSTVTLVAGKGRIEKYVFPMYFLLLKRHYEILRLARMHILHNNELWVATDSLLWLNDAVESRYKRVRDVFVERELDVERKFAMFACGLFRMRYKEEQEPNKDLWAKSRFPEYTYDDSVEAQNVVPEEVLYYPVEGDQNFVGSAYDDPTEPETAEDQNAEEPVKSIIGAWNVFTGFGDHIYPHRPMVSVHIHASDYGALNFEGAGTNYEPTPFTLTGECLPPSEKQQAVGEVPVKFTMRYSARIDTQYLEGVLQAGGTMMTGRWRYKGDKDIEWGGDFIFSRMPADVLCCRPALTEFRANRPRALWKFAVTAVLDQVRRQLFSWSHIKARRDVRKRFIELYIRYLKLFGPPIKDDFPELVRITRLITTRDVRLYQSIRVYQLRTTPIHFNSHCAKCKGQIGGARLICLDCANPDKPLNLCGDTDCAHAKVARSDLSFPHLPGHAMLRTRRVIHTRDFSRVMSHARRTFKDAERILQNCDGLHKSQTAGSTPTDSPPTVVVWCQICKKNVPATVPFWLCITCSGKFLSILWRSSSRAFLRESSRKLQVRMHEV